MAYDWHGHREFAGAQILYDTMPIQIEKAMLRFLGRSTLHRDAKPIRSLTISGITISPQTESRLRAIVEHVEVMSTSKLILPCVVRCSKPCLLLSLFFFFGTYRFKLIPAP